MLNKRTAVPSRAVPGRTGPQMMRLVADLLEAIPNLPQVSVTVSEPISDDHITSVSIQVSFWLPPREKFPAVSRILRHFGGGGAVARPVADGWHFSGSARWHGADITVFAATHVDDTGRSGEPTAA